MWLHFWNALADFFFGLSGIEKIKRSTLTYKIDVRTLMALIGFDKIGFLTGLE
jgi:hypothetical protein